MAEYRITKIAWISLAAASLFGAACSRFNGKNTVDHRTQHSGNDATANSSLRQALTVMPDKFFKPSAKPADPGVCTDGTGTLPSLPEVRATDSYLNNCSGCHGTAGEGHGDFPALRGFDKTRFMSIVRHGGSKMPAFGAELISDDELSKNYDLINAKDPLTAFDSQVNIPQTTSSVSDEDYANIMKEGLLAWRTPGDRGACMSCHGPDGIDLARVNYPTSAILRRAVGQGLSGENGMKIAKMITAQRTHYQITNPCVAKNFKPFQPGNKLLGGSTAIGRDRALIDALTAKTVSLGSNSQSLDDAKKIVASITALNPSDVPIAISLNHWTEDGFHGDDHRSQAKWIPEIPMEPTSDDFEKQWVSVQNTYLEDPSDANLWALLDQVPHLDGSRFTTTGVSQRLARERYQSVLLFQHMMRFNATKLPDLAKTQSLDRFSIWETAQISNVMARGCSDGGTDAEPYPCWNYPATFYKKMGTDRERLLKDVIKIDYPWLIAGWMVDPALQLTEGGDAQMQHFHAAAETLFDTFNDLQGQYNRLPIHSIYFSFTRLVKSIEATDDRFPIGSSLDKKPVKSCWGNIEAGIKQWISATLPALDRDMDTAKSPSISSDHRQLVLAAVANIDNILLLMMKDGLANQSAACSAAKSGDNSKRIIDTVDQLSAWHSKHQISNAQFDSLVSQIKGQK